MCAWGGEENLTPTCPGKAGASSPLEGEAEEEKDFEVPTCRSFAAASSPLEGEEKTESFLFISPLRGNSTTVSFLSSKVRERGCFPDSLD